jgi:hypothetical protein
MLFAMPRIIVVLDYLCAGAALIAALLWLWSAMVTIPTPGKFPIMVSRPDAALGPIGPPLGGTFVGFGTSKELQDWTSEVSKAFAVQSIVAHGRLPFQPLRHYRQQ